MTIWKLALIGAVAFSVSGCGSLIDTKPARCDGYSKRPLNKSLWDWDNKDPTPAEPPAVKQVKPIVRKAETAPGKSTTSAPLVAKVDSTVMLPLPFLPVAQPQAFQFAPNLTNILLPAQFQKPENSSGPGLSFWRETESLKACG